MTAELLLAAAVAIGPFRSSAHRDLIKGEGAYEEGRYEKALKHFRNAQVDLPEEETVLYDLGCAQYQLQKYEKAGESFKKSALSPQEEVSIASTYNLGNCLFHLGDLEGAIEAYQRVLERDEDHEDARFNLEYVRQKIKEMLDSSKERQKQEENQQEENQEGQSQETQGNDASKDKEQEGEEPAGEGQVDEKQGDEKEENKGSEEEEGDVEQEAEGQENGPAGGEQQDGQTREEGSSEEDNVKVLEMTQEEAERLLKALAQEEEELRQKDLRKIPGQRGTGGPDW